MLAKCYGVEKGKAQKAFNVRVLGKLSYTVENRVHILLR